MIDYPKNATTEEKMVLARALFHINHFPETKPIVDWLKNELHRMDKLNRTERDDINNKHRQGACQAISKLLSMVAESRDMFDRFDATRNGKP